MLKKRDLRVRNNECVGRCAKICAGKVCVKNLIKKVFGEDNKRGEKSHAFICVIKHDKKEKYEIDSVSNIITSRAQNL